MSDEQNERLALLNEALSAYEWLLKRKYNIKLGYKNSETEIDLVFLNKNFVHVAGINKLSDIWTNDISASSFYRLLTNDDNYKRIVISSQMFNIIVGRLRSIIDLKDNLEDVENNRHIKFVRRDSQYHTSIKYDYLIISHFGNDSYHYFLRLSGNSNNRKECVLISTFIENARDYSIGQQQMTLLRKSIVELENNVETIIFERT